jgi:hypothetical protein
VCVCVRARARARGAVSASFQSRFTSYIQYNYRNTIPKSVDHICRFDFYRFGGLRACVRAARTRSVSCGMAWIFS